MFPKKKYLSGIVNSVIITVIYSIISGLISGLESLFAGIVILSVLGLIGGLIGVLIYREHNELSYYKLIRFDLMKDVSKNDASKFVLAIQER